MSVDVDGNVGRIWKNDGEDFEEVGERETIIKCYTMKKNLLSIKKYKNNIKK